MSQSTKVESERGRHMCGGKGPDGMGQDREGTGPHKLGHQTDTKTGPKLLWFVFILVFCFV